MVNGDPPPIELAVTQEVADVIEAIGVIIDRSVIVCAFATDIQVVYFGWLIATEDIVDTSEATDAPEAIFLPNAENGNEDDDDIGVGMFIIVFG